MNRKVFLYSNVSEESLALKDRVASKVEEYGMTRQDELTPDTDLIICIGGDGTYLRMIHDYDMPGTPTIGINTGHLGFFQEILPDQIDILFDRYLRHDYEIQRLSTIRAEIVLPDHTENVVGLNEIVVRGEPGKNIHILLSIGESFIEKFSGDGILVATPAGSTAYNYALGGCIVDPRLELLQVTPIAPMNNRSYRSFSSGLALPSSLTLEVLPDKASAESNFVQIETDGFIYKYNSIERIRIGYSFRKLQTLRFADYDFWRKVMEKFL